MISPESIHSLLAGDESSSSGSSFYSSSSSSSEYSSYSDLSDPFYDLEEPKVTIEQNAVTQVIENEAYCFNVQGFAEKLVDATFIEADKFLNSKEEVKYPSYYPCDLYRENIFEESKSSESEVESTSSFWPEISDFTIKLGLEKIELFVETWQRSNDWKFCVEFVGFECEDCSNIFVYQVEWSKPTMTYPIPQATANVFFALDVYKMVPHNYRSYVEVSYIFECSTVIHHPGKIDFQEKWLEDILDAKLRLFKTITFSLRCCVLAMILLYCYITLAGFLLSSSKQGCFITPLKLSEIVKLRSSKKPIMIKKIYFYNKKLKNK